MKKIKLTQGFVALVSDKDYSRIKKWKWCAFVNRYGVYAKRRKPGPKLPYKVILMHRDVLSAEPGTFVDHKNGNGLDNRRSNLRICTAEQNAQNRNNLQRNNTSGATGVSWDKGCQKWVVRVHKKRKPIHVGVFTSLSEAILARKKAARKLYGQYAGGV